MTQMTQPTPLTQIRIDFELKNWLKHRAIDNGRTLQQEVVHRLEESRRVQADREHRKSAAA
ncbi:hypothetical protein [Delftia acidovorans]